MLLKADWVLPVSSPPVANGAVLVEDGCIVRVGPADELAQGYDGEALDFGEAAILPGFVDLHTHLEYSVFRGLCDDLSYPDWKIQVTQRSAALAPADWAASARLGALEAIRSGITCIADISSSGGSLDASLAAGLRGLAFYELTGMDDSRVSETIGAAKEAVLAWQAKAVGSHMMVGLAPHSPYSVAPPLFKAVSQWARQDGFMMCVHLAGSKEEVEFVKYASGKLATVYRDLVGWSDLLWQPTGVSPVKYLEEWEVFDGPVLAVHCIQVDEADIDILQKHDVAIAHCPKCGAKWGMGVAPLPEFLRRQLRVGIGTDSPASNNTMDFFDEMRVGLLLQRGSKRTVEGLSAAEFVSLATEGGAGALGLGASIGTLEPGKQADVVAVDLSHSHQKPVQDPYSALVYTANQENVILTMVNGRVLFLAGVYETLDREKIVADAEQVRAKLGG